MPRSSKPQPPGSAQPDSGATRPPVVAVQVGLPVPDSITQALPFTPPTPVGAAQYRILKTTEVDEYDPGALTVQTTPAVPPTGDQYQGTARTAAKLSLGKNKIEVFADLQDLIRSLPSEAAMIHHAPPITTTSTSGRVAEEQRQVRLRVFLYAASREMDNDFHLIFGRDPSKAPELYMTMELSGLPPSSSPAYKSLKATRDVYKAFFQAQLPGLTYDFYNPPIPVEIEGSLFFDITHATGSRPGPPSLKSRMPTIWEVHPLSKLVFKP